MSFAWSTLIILVAVAVWLYFYVKHALKRREEQSQTKYARKGESWRKR